MVNERRAVPCLVLDRRYAQSASLEHPIGPSFGVIVRSGWESLKLLIVA